MNNGGYFHSWVVYCISFADLLLPLSLTDNRTSDGDACDEVEMATEVCTSIDDDDAHTRLPRRVLTKTFVDVA